MPRRVSGSILVAIVLIAVGFPTAVPAADGVPELVKDIRTLGPQDATPTGLVDVGGTLYFAATSAANGTELWKSNGTEAGTVLVKDIVMGTGSSSPTNLMAVGSTLYFAATDGTSGVELYKSDGTEGGTTRVEDIAPAGASSSPANLLAVGSTLYFTATDGTSGIELYKSDGTEPGTGRIKDIWSGSGSSSPSWLTAVGSRVYFAAISGSTAADGGIELYKTDGSEGDTGRVEDIWPGINGSTPDWLVAFQGKVYFAATDGADREFWVSDGTNGAGTAELKDIWFETSSGFPQEMVATSEAIYFSAIDDDGQELWTSDGTTNGTVQLKDILPSSDSGAPTALTANRDDFFFWALDGFPGSMRPWRSDGTAAGTIPLRTDIKANAAPDRLGVTAAGTGWLFGAEDTDGDFELWKTDGSQAGTVFVRNINLATGSNTDSFPTQLTTIGTTVFMSAKTEAAGRELWRSDGSDAGTSLVKDIHRTTPGSEIQGLIAGDGLLYFVANEGDQGRRLWRSDGTEAGTFRVSDLEPQRGPFSNTVEMAALGDHMYFSAGDGEHGIELWRTDGTLAGTELAADVWDGDDSGSPDSMTVVGDTLYFIAQNPLVGWELWKSDGTDAGTVQVREIISGLNNSDFKDLTAAGDTLYFTTMDSGPPSSHGIELWKSDGSEAGTMMVKDIRPGSSSSIPASASTRPGFVTSIGDVVYFIATDGSGGNQIWKSDGTGPGTVKVKPTGGYTVATSPNKIAAAGDYVFFEGIDTTSSHELWRTDGTPAGTIPLVQGIGAGPTRLTGTGDDVFFTANDGSGTGDELWHSDGTVAGTGFVKDIQPGSIGSGSNEFTQVAGVVFFAANDGAGAHGSELWRTDGTEAGTSLVADIRPGQSSSFSGLAEMAEVDGVLFLRADDGVIGPELWKLEPQVVDLVETDVTITPAVAKPEREISVTETASNAGTLDAGPSTTRFYLSRDQTKDPDDIRLKKNRRVPALAAGAVSTGTKKMLVPDVRSAYYYVLACADDTVLVVEDTESNNCTASSTRLYVKNKDVDLVVSGVDPPPATSTPGGVFVQGDRAWNSGTGDAPASSTTRYLLSRDKSRSARDLRLDGSRIVPALAAGAEHAGSASLTVPATAAGDYYVLACVDFPREIAERNEENNCRASPSRIAIS